MADIIIKENLDIAMKIDDIYYGVDEIIDDYRSVDFELKNVVNDIYSDEFDIGLNSDSDVIIYDCNDSENETEYAIKYHYKTMLERLKDVYASAEREIDRVIKELYDFSVSIEKR